MTSVAAARHEWAEGHRRFVAEARDRARSDLLHQQRDSVVDELRRRVGGVFTLAELAAAYEGSERWVREVVDEHAPARGGLRTATLAGDAAFHAYSRHAQDYEP